MSGPKPFVNLEFRQVDNGFILIRDIPDSARGIVRKSATVYKEIDEIFTAIKNICGEDNVIQFKPPEGPTVH